MSGTIGLVSSYSDLCGNASYTRALAGGLEALGFRVEIFDLDQSLLRSQLPAHIRKGDALIRSFAERAAALDGVNIQYEYGLFGLTPDVVRRRMRLLLEGCPAGHLSLCLHRFDTDGYASAFRNLVLSCVRLSASGCRRSMNEVRRAVMAGVGRDVIGRALKKGGTLIVHTRKERESVLAFFPAAASRVADHPICFSDPHTEEHRTEQERAAFFSRCGLAPDTVLIGVFGFLTEYKGFVTAVEALAHLPPNHVLGIFGGQHPASIVHEPFGNPYLRQLENVIRKKRLGNRVRFFGVQETDEGMARNMRVCRHVVLPYFEVGQSGSGVASLAFENNPSVHMARNLAFLELKKYFGTAFQMFDIGNSYELAEKIVHNPESDMLAEARCAARKRYNLSSNIQVYVKSMNIQ